MKLKDLLKLANSIKQNAPNVIYIRKPKYKNIYKKLLKESLKIK